MKNYIGISRDHSGSMTMIRKPAMLDYNEKIVSIQEAAKTHDIDTIVSVVKCGAGRPAKVVPEIINSDISRLRPISDYVSDGNSTPLFDSVGYLIEQFESVPDYDDINVSFMILVITDGEENSSVKWNARRLSEKIKKLQASDRWTFAFRVPKGHKTHLVNLGIPSGNILEWEQSEAGMKTSTNIESSAISQYYSDRSRGVMCSKSFYSADIGNVDIKTVKRKLVDISKDVTFLGVSHKSDGAQIRDFVQEMMHQYVKGTAFYQLTKSETVQDYKMIVILDKYKNNVYYGEAARDLLNIPKVGDIKLRPGTQGQYEVYIQSTSVNRKVYTGTNVLIWPQANNH